MKKKVSLIVMAFMAIALVVKAALSFTETSEVYAVPEAFTPTDGQVVQATPSVQLTYGVDGQWKKSVSNGFDDKLKYSVVGNNNPKDGELAGDPPTNSGNGYTEAKKNLPISGTYYIFSPSKAGTITAGVKLGANKSIYVVDAADGTCLSSTIKVTDLEGNEQTLRAGDKANNINEYSLEAELKTAYVEFAVEAGKSYYLFCSGSKMAFWGFYFTPELTPHAITTNVTPANVAAFTYNVDNATTQGTQAKAGETVKLTGVTLDGNYDEQDFLGLTITTASGKTVSWTNSGNAFISGVPAFEFTMPDEPVTVTAQFKYDIECAAGVAGGTFSTNPTKAKAGEEVTITTTPDPGMKVGGITVIGKTTNQAVTVTDNKFIMPADGVVVNVSFITATHTITTIVNPEGAATVTYNKSTPTTSYVLAAPGEEVELKGVTLGEGVTNEDYQGLTITTASGIDVKYSTNGWEGPVPAFKFTMPDEDVVVALNFKSNTPETPTVISWQLVEPADLVTGDIVVIVDTTTVTAMSNDQGSSKAPQATAITLNAAKNALADQPADNLQWKAVVEDGSYAFVVGEDSLYCIASNNGVRVSHNNPNTKFTIAQDEDKNNFLLNTATSRYIGVYLYKGTPQDWRCYTSINANIKNTRTAFYKKVEGSIPVDEKYPVNVRVMPEGAATITLNATEAAFGEVVELKSVALGEGYTDTSFKEISITDASGAPVTWSNGGKFENGVPAFKFNMPEGGVVIALTFNEPEPEPVSDVYYQKINTNEELTDGEYLIVYEDADGNKAFNGALKTLDAINNYIDVTISDDNKIASSDVVDASTFTINTTEKSVKSAGGLYIGQTSYANGLASNADAAIENNISIDGIGNAVITCTTDGGDVTLRFNNASNQQRFRYYKSGQQAVALYKKVDAAQGPADMVIVADEITEGDIAAAIERKAGDKPYKKLTLNLSDESGAYTISKPIVGYESVVINGNGATIDASQLTGPFIQMSETPTVEPVTKTDEGGVETIVAYPVDEITIDNVEIKGLAKQLFYANKQKYLIKKLSVENSIIGISGAAKKTIFDFAGGGNAEEIVVENSSLWADAKQEQAGGLLSSQTGQGAGDLGGTKQLLSIQNSTLYNISYGKNTNNQRRNNVAGMEYDIRNNVIVNCGKKGQFIKGLNGGSAMNSKNVKWTVESNIFNFDGEDVSAAEQENAGENEYVAATGARSEGNSLTELANPIVKNSVAGVVEFEDAANGFFGGNVKFTSEAPSSIVVGDPRWTLTPVQEIPTGINGASLNDNVEMINDNDTPAYNLAGQKVGKGYKGIVVKNGKKVVMK